MQFPQSLLVGGDITPRDRRIRLCLFLLWLLLVGWFLSDHPFWRDEVRAFSLALSGSNIVEMLGVAHGEGHPALWYLILRGAHDIFPYPQVLPVAGAVIGIATMAVMAYYAPFRTAIVAIILFSLYGAFEYVVVARNYGITALVMFSLAALYGRVRNTLWFGFILALLCNTNVPSSFLAAALLLFRFVEMLTDGELQAKRNWLIFAGNALLAAVGAYLCFRMIYPTFNDAAVSPNLNDLGVGNFINAVFDTEYGFFNLGIPAIVLAISCLGLIRRPAALCAALAGFLGLKLFFYFVYLSYYRHEILFVVFLIALYWLSAKGFGGTWRQKPWMDGVQFAGHLAFIALLLMQSVLLAVPFLVKAQGFPFSRSADVAKILKRPEYSQAIVMADPDTMLEPLPYYVDNPLWLLRQQRFGRVVHLTNNARHNLTLDDVLADAERLHRESGRPVVFLSRLRLQPVYRKPKMMYEGTTTTITPASYYRFRASTRLIATLRPASTDEHYDVYVYPR